MPVFLIVQDFWEYLGYILSLLHEVFDIVLIHVYTTSDGSFDITIGQFIFYCLLIPIFLHLLLPSARGT